MLRFSRYDDAMDSEDTNLPLLASEAVTLKYILGSRTQQQDSVDTSVALLCHLLHVPEMTHRSPTTH